jgi:NNP family nitrate/nitrite transporter-like MFS transporter
MASFKAVMKSGHPPTLLAAFLYFDFCFAIWVLNGAMAPFLTKAFSLSDTQKGLMISIPTLAGALMRFPLGVISQYIGRKNAAIVEMSIIVVAMMFGWLFISSFSDVLIMGIMLGIAGASFGVALSLGSGWFPPEYKGLAMGIAGAGNSGTVVALLAAPPLAAAYGWQNVYAFAALFMLLPLLVMIFLAKEPPDQEHQSLKEHVACLWQLDGWAFNLIYVITFGGFIGLSTFLPSFFNTQYGVSGVVAAQLTVLAAVMGSAIRIVGGYVADRLGGLLVLAVVLMAVVGVFLLLPTSPSITVTTLLFMLCFAILGMGNGALFQLVPHRWPNNTAVASSMIGEIGALGGAILPNVMFQSRSITGSFGMGFIGYAVLTGLILVMLLFMRRRWAGTWVTAAGKPMPRGAATTATSGPRGPMATAH